MLRDKQKTFYAWLLTYFEREGKSPTIREIQAGLDYSSPDLVRRMLVRLQAQGLVEVTEREPRSIKLVGYKLVLVKEKAT